MSVVLLTAKPRRIDPEAVEDRFARRHIPLIARHDPRRIARNRQLDQTVAGLVPEVRPPEIRRC